MNKTFYILPILLLFVSCIDEFDPQINDFEDLLVVEASINKGNATQEVKISRTSSIGEFENRPVTGCSVWVDDNDGNSYLFYENNEGSYSADIPQEALQYGKQFKLFIVTANGVEYESDYETILESSPVDSVYYIKEAAQTSAEYFNEAYQFYVDIKAPDEASKFYRWELVETWEHRSTFDIGAYYYSKCNCIEELSGEELFALRDSTRRCWTTRKVKGFYSSSTQNLTINEKKKIPLSFERTSSYKMDHKYSLLVRQYTLSEAAYLYWNKMKIESMESGGLYQTQPGQAITNIRNLNNPDEIVLGFFWASSFTEKRFFIEKGNPLSFGYSKYGECFLASVDGPPAIPYVGNRVIPLHYSLFEGPRTAHSGDPTVAEIDGGGEGVIPTAERIDCFDCRVQEDGASPVMPDFWE